MTSLKEALRAARAPSSISRQSSRRMTASCRKSLAKRLPWNGVMMLMRRQFSNQLVGILSQPQADGGDLRALERLHAIKFTLLSKKDQCNNRELDRGIPKEIQEVSWAATLVLPPVPDSVLRLVLAVDSARLRCDHDVTPDLYDGLDPTPAASVLAYTDSCTNALP